MNSIMEVWTKINMKIADFSKKNVFQTLLQKWSYFLKRNRVTNAEIYCFYYPQDFSNTAEYDHSWLLVGEPIFEKLRISDGSLDIWREIYREPQGVSKSYSVHLAELELNPTEDYEWFAEPIDSADVAEKTRLLDNGSAAGIDRFSKENLAHVGTKALVNWFNRFLEVGASPKALKQFGSPKTPKRYRMVLIPKFKGAAYPKDYR